MQVRELLSGQGVNLEDMVDAGFALYVGEHSEEDISRLRAECTELLSKYISDPNVGMLILAAIHLDKVVAEETSGLFSSSKDPAALVADELIGMAIAEYIAGKRGLFNYVRYDRAKPGILAELPPFLDDAIAALVAGTMTILLED